MEGILFNVSKGKFLTIFPFSKFSHPFSDIYFPYYELFKKIFLFLKGPIEILKFRSSFNFYI